MTKRDMERRRRALLKLDACLQCILKLRGIPIALRNITRALHNRIQVAVLKYDLRLRPSK